MGEIVIDRFELLDPNVKTDAVMERSFEAYSDLLATRNAEHPQRQGLQYNEFVNAMQCNDVVCSTAYTERGRFEVPQLGPVSQFEWLNTSRYESEFPEQWSCGNVLHFIDLPGVEPSDAVKERLSQLAANGGVLVFDYPLSDEDYVTRVESLIDSTGCNREETLILAKQTYFAGQAILKRKDVVEGPVVPLVEAFDRALLNGSYSRSRMVSGASVMKSVAYEDASYMNMFYEAAYQKLNAVEFCNQGLTPEEFLHLMTEDKNTVKIVNKVEDEIVSLMLLDNELSKLTWINSNYYRDRYPEKYEKGEVMWFPGLAANPYKKGGKNTQVMIDLVAELLESGNNEILVVFDCGIINTGTLDLFLNRKINKTPSVGIDIKPIAEQNYCAIKLSA